MVRLKDIAERVGVSISTVSRVIQNDSSRNVNPEIKRKVWMAVKEMGYTPNENARRLVYSSEEKKRQTKRIGWLANPRIANENPYFSKIFIGISETLNKAGYSLLLLHSDDLEEENQFQRMVREKEIEGILLVDPVRKETLAELKKWIPVVGVDFNYSDHSLSVVDYDREEAAWKGVEHLVSKGHTRIGFIGGGVDGDLHLEKRFKGYLKAMREFGLEINEKFIVDTEWYLERSYEWLKMTIEQSDGDLPTGFLCASDLLAIAAMRAVQEKGLSIPDDVAFVGIDNNDLAQYVVPALTTISIPQYEMGVVAAKALLNLIAEESDRIDLKTFVATELIIRKST
ncbi:LacI family transcriptional regulator [Sporosarcina luteola]|uniref:LacI family transcriptional regulator n=1 Tax=Sporosarcina luteola TaxID=582850 RepID=A0A511Z4N0_9BACL|nr:LacI family DNA-binding transcriptional regulator [Sporosarcina luteola]GEN82390.1 LacI family transcriptional regulator [Sporosarcina luteola]